MHSILKRQLEKVFGDKSITSFDLEFQKLFEAISSTYSGFDDDREMIERSLELSSNELREKNKKLQEDLEKLKKGAVHIEKLENSRRAVLNILKDLKEAKEEAEAAKDKFEKMAKSEQENRLQLEQLNKVMVGRELKMVELKEKLANYEKHSQTSGHKTP